MLALASRGAVRGFGARYVAALRLLARLRWMYYLHGIDCGLLAFVGWMSAVGWMHRSRLDVLRLIACRCRLYAGAGFDDLGCLWRKYCLRGAWRVYRYQAGRKGLAVLFHLGF